MSDKPPNKVTYMPSPPKIPTQPTPAPNVYTDDEPFLTIAQAAAVAGMHTRTLYLRIKQGKLPCYGSTNNYRVKLSHVLPRFSVNEIKQGRRAEATRRQHAEKSRQGVTVQ